MAGIKIGEGCSNVYIGDSLFRGVDVPIEAVGAENVVIENTKARQYSDTGLRARDSTISARGLDFSSPNAAYGLDLTNSVTANVVDSRFLNHQEADIAYGPGVIGDFHDVTASTLYDRARRRSPIASENPRTVNRLVTTEARQLDREHRLRRLARNASVASTGYGVLEALGLSPL